MEQEPNLNIGNYGRGNNGRFVEINNTTLYFSYNTIVAFSTPETGLKVCKNVWSTTTGGHLNAIDGGDKGGRLNRDEFVRQLNKAIEERGL